jgi:hypothetical protein
MTQGFGVPLITLYTSDPTIPGSNPIGYIITDHNRQPLQITYDRLEDVNRMADGTMRRFITANKKKFSTSWENVPAAGGYNFTADSNLGAAWLKSFYEDNVYNPVWVKFTYAEESWRFPNSQSITSGNRSLATNKTFNRTAQNVLYPNSFSVASVAFSAIASGSGTASIVTSVNHSFTTASTPEIFITGVNQLMNGTWLINNALNNLITFRFSENGNASVSFKINSYVQNGSSANFNTDSTSFINNGASIVISNSRNNSGSTVNGLWIVVGTPISQTVFTASSATSNQVGAGFYGDASIYNSSSWIQYISANAGVVGPAVSSDIVKTFITNFTYDIQKRYTYTDLINMNIEFTEI